MWKRTLTITICSGLMCCGLVACGDDTPDGVNQGPPQVGDGPPPPPNRVPGANQPGAVGGAVGQDDGPQ